MGCFRTREFGHALGVLSHDIVDPIERPMNGRIHFAAFLKPVFDLKKVVRPCFLGIFEQMFRQLARFQQMRSKKFSVIKQIYNVMRSTFVYKNITKQNKMTMFV